MCMCVRETEKRQTCREERETEERETKRQTDRDTERVRERCAYVFLCLPLYVGVHVHTSAGV